MVKQNEKKSMKVDIQKNQVTPVGNMAITPAIQEIEADGLL